MAPRLSLAEQISQLDRPAPDFGAEDFINPGRGQDDDVIEEEASGARDHYLDVGTSSLRRLQDSVADPKYEGARTSRQQLSSINHDSDSEEGDDDDQYGEEVEEKEDESEMEENHAQPEPSPDDSDQEDEDIRTSVDLGPTHVEKKKQTNESEALTSTLRKTREGDRKKGLAVSRQIDIWDGLLDARIRFQKTSVAAHRLPAQQWTMVRESDQCRESLFRMLEEARLLSEELFELQEALASNESVSLPPRKRRRTETPETVTDYKTDLETASESLSSLEHVFHPHLIQTLNKWSSKIQAVAPSVLLPTNRNAFSKDRSHVKSAVQLIDENLQDHAKLLSRTQVWRGKGSRIGLPSEQEKHEDLFDDTDFYQQLLRDVIDARDNSGANDWIVAQKERKSRKKVDTKASKGRKLRYEVHEKIRNFMVPITVRGAWHEEQIDELFASVLGKGFENTSKTLGLSTEATESAMQVDAGNLEGFRLFG